MLDAAVGHGPQVAHDVLAKAGPTARFLGLGVEERRALAEGPLREALSVRDRPRARRRAARAGVQRRLLQGFSLREMARTLLDAGAVEVSGVVLARRKGG